jgi:hypothetical protein
MVSDEECFAEQIITLYFIVSCEFGAQHIREALIMTVAKMPAYCINTLLPVGICEPPVTAYSEDVVATTHIVVACCFIHFFIEVNHFSSTSVILYLFGELLKYVITGLGRYPIRLAS